jgi:two-component system, OmpR family, sensor histidine kinase KdpD
MVVPLKAIMRTRGVLIIEPIKDRLLSPEQRQLLDTCASLLAISLERIHYIEVAQASTVQIESERLRNSLLSAISHDLRTPLASLVGLADTLELTSPAPNEQQLLISRAIRQSAVRMSALVGNLLDMARLEAGAVQLNRQWLPLEEVVGSALALCDAQLGQRPVRVDLADDLPLLHLDAVLFERVLVNLLENAAKYTPEGTPISINARAGGGQVSTTKARACRRARRRPSSRNSSAATRRAPPRVWAWAWPSAGRSCRRMAVRSPGPIAKRAGHALPLPCLKGCRPPTTAASC